MRYYWTIREAEFVRNNYEKMTDEEIASELGMTRQKVKNFRYRNKLSKGTNTGRFQKGQQPWNKGKKVDIGGKATRFQKGHEPHNTLFDNAIVIRKDKTGRSYKYIRISKGKWVALHRYNYEKLNGPIPKSKILVCKDGNPLNCDPQNWELITRAENVRRIYNRKKASRSLKNAWAVSRAFNDYGLTPQKFKSIFQRQL